MSNLAVIYAGDLVSVAEAFAAAARDLSGAVRVRALDEDRRRHTATHPPADLADLEWADGIAFGTPIGAGCPAPSLMRFLARTEPLWSSGRLYDKAVTVFTDEPEHLAPDSVLHPVYDVLYPWGAVIVGPRAFELEPDARPGRASDDASSSLAAPRLRSARHRAGRLARLATVLAEHRHRLERLQF